MSNFPPPRVWSEEECIPFDTAFRPAVILDRPPPQRPDADTFDISADIGFDRAGEKFRVRLTGEEWLHTGGKIGFNAWERKGEDKPRGNAAWERARLLVPAGTRVRFRSWRGGSRGSMYRWLGLILVRLFMVDGVLRREVVSLTEVANWYSLADVLIHEGHGREWWRGWSRGRKRPV